MNYISELGQRSGWQERDKLEDTGVILNNRTKTVNNESRSLESLIISVTSRSSNHRQIRPPHYFDDRYLPNLGCHSSASHTGSTLRSASREAATEIPSAGSGAILDRPVAGWSGLDWTRMEALLVSIVRHYVVSYCTVSHVEASSPHSLSSDGDSLRSVTRSSIIYRSMSVWSDTSMQLSRVLQRYRPAPPAAD